MSFLNSYGRIFFMKWLSQSSDVHKCPFHHWDSGFLSSVKERVGFIRSPHAKIYKEEEITLELAQKAQQEFCDRWLEYEFGQSAFRDLVGSIWAILMRNALERYRWLKWLKLTRTNYQKKLPKILKTCIDEESVSFFSRIVDGPEIHKILDDLSSQATSQINTIFDKKPHLRGVTFVEFIKNSQVSTAFSTVDKIFIPLCDKGLDKELFNAIIQDSGLQLLKDIAWWWNHLEHRIMAGTAALGRPPAFTKLSGNGEALQFQIPPHQLFQEGHTISHFSCWALFQPGNDGYKNLFEEFVLTLWTTYGDIFCEGAQV